MYIRACSVSHTDTPSEFPKGKKGSEEYCHVPRPAGRKFFLHATTRLPARQPVVPSTGVPPIASHTVVHPHQHLKYLAKALLQDQHTMLLLHDHSWVLHGRAVTESSYQNYNIIII